MDQKIWPVAEQSKERNGRGEKNTIPYTQSLPLKGGQGRRVKCGGWGYHDQGTENMFSSERRLAVFWTN